MPKILLEKLQTLQCHFTWDIKFEAFVDMDACLTYLNYKWKHSPYCNRGIYIALKAFLYCQQRCYAEALESLLTAEVVVMQDCPANAPFHSLVTYGNYAWVYYHLANFPKVEFYLAEIHRVCQSLNSPQPYSVMTPEILAQKGWSLLAGGPPGGEEATKCFQTALRDDSSNEEFKGGLGSCLYVSWEWFETLFYWDKAKEVLEEIVLTQPQNYEAKLYLADLLLGLHQERAMWLLEDVVQNSCSAEVLRKAAKLYVRANPQQLHQAISISKKAISLDPTYHLLYYNLGMYYKYQMLEQTSSEERAAVMEAATANLQRAAETDFLFVLPMLELAKIYGETNSDYEEEIYLHLMEELPMVSKPSQQAIHIFWGDFLLHKKGQKRQALDTFLAGLKISESRLKEKRALKKRVMMLAEMFQEDSDMDQVDVIRQFFQTMEG